MERQPVYQQVNTENATLSQPVDAVTLSHREEREIFNRQWAQEKQVRHMDNVQHFTGYLRPGKYIHAGIGQTKASGV